jgi:uncharacterized protein YgbK (DUF1537 family)
VTSVNLKVLILADDLTGACDSAVAFATRGLRTDAWIAEPCSFAEESRPLRQTEVLALNTASRHLPVKEAAFRLAEVVKWARLQTPRMLFKKIDSLFRGNTFNEICAMSSLFPDYHFLLAPAYPGNGRTTKNGCVEAASLSWHPLDAGAELKSCGLAPHIIDACDAAAAIARALAAHKTFLLCDAASDDDLDVIVQATLSLTPRAIWMGSGGLAAALARTFAAASVKAKPRRILGPMIFCIGSSHEVTHRQLLRLVQDREVIDLSLDYAPEVLFADACNSGKSLLVRMADPKMTSAHLATVLSRFIERKCTLVLSGGETALQVCHTLGATSLYLEDELLPGVACGRLRGGLAEGTQVLTKSGAFGGPETLAVLESMVVWDKKIQERCHA